MKKNFLKNISYIQLLFFVLIVCLYWFNLIAMHTFIGVISLTILFITTIISFICETMSFKERIIVVSISLISIATVIITHFIIVKNPISYSYEEVNGEIKITGYDCNIANNYGEFYIDIPSHINGKEVKVIGKRAFSGSNDAFEISIPDTVEIIEEEAFSMSNVSFISLPNGLAYIGERAFYYTWIDFIFVPESVEYIGANAFTSIDIIALEKSELKKDFEENWLEKNSIIYLSSTGVEKKDSIVYVLHENMEATVADLPDYSHEKVAIPDIIIVNDQKYVVTTIGSYSGDNTSFESLVIPQTISKICSNAFSNKNIETIFIPASVKYIEKGAFLGCDNLKILVENFEKPLGWDNEWNIENREVEWNICLEEDNV